MNHLWYVFHSFRYVFHTSFFAVNCLPLDKHSVVQEFPTVFNGNIDSMEGEKFPFILLMTLNPSALTPPGLFHMLTVINLKLNFVL